MMTRVQWQRPRCETLRILRILTLTYLSKYWTPKLLAGTSIVFDLGIHTTLSRKLLKKNTNLCVTLNLAKNYESLWNRVVVENY